MFLARMCLARMRDWMNKVKLCTFLVVVTAGLISCGGSSNNDQGTAFTLYGFFSPADGSPIVGTVFSLNVDQEVESTFAVEAQYGLQNNLSAQGIRVQRVLMDYYIEGADIQPPSSTQPLGVLLGPAGGEFSSSLPESFANIASISMSSALIVPPDVLAYINLNKNSLPEPPFTMTVHTYATGVTTAGDRIDSNELEFLVQFVPDNIITPTDGTEPDAGVSTGEEVIESE